VIISQSGHLSFFPFLFFSYFAPLEYPSLSIAPVATIASSFSSVTSSHPSSLSSLKTKKKGMYEFKNCPGKQDKILEVESQKETKKKKKSPRKTTVYQRMM
jgi:hypothetical protein